MIRGINDAVLLNPSKRKPRTHSVMFREGAYRAPLYVDIKGERVVCSCPAFALTRRCRHIRYLRYGKVRFIKHSHFKTFAKVIRRYIDRCEKEYRAVRAVYLEALKKSPTVTADDMHCAVMDIRCDPRINGAVLSVLKRQGLIKLARFTHSKRGRAHHRRICVFKRGSEWKHRKLVRVTRSKRGRRR